MGTRGIRFLLGLRRGGRGGAGGATGTARREGSGVSAKEATRARPKRGPGERVMASSAGASTKDEPLAEDELGPPEIMALGSAKTSRIPKRA